MFDEDFLVSPGALMDSGDIFLEIPFPNMKWPLEAMRPYPKHKIESMGVPYLPVNETALGKDDIVKVTVQRRTIMLLSHGCEVDKIIEYPFDSLKKHHWLCAPIDPLSKCAPDQKLRVLAGTQPNKFYIPADKRISNEEMVVDLRRITPINCTYLIDDKKHNRAVCSIGQKYKDDLKAKLLEFFCRIALLSHFECPNCKEAIDIRDLIIPPQAD
jgi:hypothetical protein